VNFVSPIFKRDSFDDVPDQRARDGSAASKDQLHLPGIVYPVCLTSYKLPLELGSFIFCANFLRMLQEKGPSDEVLTIDFKSLGMQNRSDLLELCTYKDAAEFIIQRGIFKETDGYSSSGLSSWSAESSSESSDLEDS